jgi:signal transduction histidine kinase
MDLHSGSIQRWMESDGLSFNIIRAIEEDGQGNLWLGTSSGLSRLDAVAGKITAFNKSKGLPIEIHGHHASFRDKGVVLYFGGIGGYYSFRPDSIKTNQMIPPVVITDFRLFNKPVKIDLTRKAILTSNISYTESIKLRYNQNDISFEFAALDYYRSAENRYAYRLEGYKEDWIQTDAATRIATYTNLNPGKYTFHVKGSNNSGIWNDQGASVQIVIRPPFWKTTLAYIAYAVLFLLLLRGYIFWRTWNLRKDKSLLEQQVSERTRQIEEQKEELLQQKEELQTTLENLQKTQEQLIESEKMAALGGLVAGVAHEINTPVGIGITAITTLMDDVQKMAEKFKRNEISRGDFKDFLQSTNDTGELIQKNLERTASLIQSFKQISVDQVTEQQRPFKLKSYLNDIILSLYPKYKQKKIVFNIDCDGDLELNSYPGAFAQIFTNLILNSIVHGFHERERGTVTIGVSSTGKMLHIEYRDNGNGISKKDLPHIFEPFYTSDEHKGTGLGLNIIYNLIRQKLHGSITCESEPGTGVLFKIEIPSG